MSLAPSCGSSTSRAARATLAVAGTALALAALGCGGGSKPAAQAPADERAAPQDDGSNVIPNETMDEIGRALDRKRNIISRCLTRAIDAGELPKNARGRITLGFVIAPAGKAKDVKVIKASLDSPVLASCVIDRVGEIEFPTVPNDLPWSYTYGFEAM